MSKEDIASKYSFEAFVAASLRNWDADEVYRWAAWLAPEREWIERDIAHFTHVGGMSTLDFKDLLWRKVMMKLTACFLVLMATAVAQSTFKPCGWVTGPNALGQLVVMCAPLDTSTFQGPKGEAGPQGPAGPQGAKGDKGDQGPAGQAGKDGVVLPMGAACPTNPTTPILVVKFADGTCGVVTVVAPPTTTAGAVFVVRPGGKLEDFSTPITTR